VRTVPYTAVPDILGVVVLNACHLISAQLYLTDSVRYFQL